MKIWIDIECDCGTEFKVNPPECCFDDSKNTFDLHCPYCQGSVDYTIQFKKGAPHYE